MDKFIETENRIEVTRALAGGGGWGRFLPNGYIVSVQGDVKL